MYRLIYLFLLISPLSFDILLKNTNFFKDFVLFHSLLLPFRIFFRSNENYWPISQVLVIFFFLTSLLARAIIRKLHQVNCDIYTISLEKLKFCLSETGITETKYQRFWDEFIDSRKEQLFVYSFGRQNLKNVR